MFPLTFPTTKVSVNGWFLPLVNENENETIFKSNNEKKRKRTFYINEKRIISLIFLFKFCILFRKKFRFFTESRNYFESITCCLVKVPTPEQLSLDDKFLIQART